MAEQTGSRLDVTKEQLLQAGQAAGLAPAQAERVWTELQTLAVRPVTFGAAQVAWYFGAAVVLVAMTWLLSIFGDLYGADATLITSVVYALLFALTGVKLAENRDMRVPAGLLYVLSVIMAPVAMTSLVDVMNWQLEPSQVTLLVSGAAVVAGTLATIGTRIALVSLPALVAGWVAASSALDVAFGIGGDGVWQWVIAAYGAVLVVLGFTLDRSDGGEDYAFWTYGVGAVATYIGLTFLEKGEFAYVLYAISGLAAMLYSVLISRRVFAFAGAAVVLTWLGHLSFIVFADSPAFPIALTVIGVATIYGGVVYHRHAERIEAAIKTWLPTGR